MAEPHATAAGAMAGAGFSLTFSVMGADANALLLGLVLAVLSSVITERIDDPIKAAAVVIVSALLAGFVGPVLVGAAAGWLPGANPNDMRLALAAVIGFFFPPLCPKIIARLGQLVSGGGAA